MPERLKQSRAALVALLVALTIPGPVGCGALRRSGGAHSLTPPNQALRGGEELQGTKWKIKSAVAETARVVGAAVALVAWLGFEMWCDDDEDEY